MTKDIRNRLTLDECTKDMDTGRIYQRRGHWQNVPKTWTLAGFGRDRHLKDVPQRCTLAGCT